MDKRETLKSTLIFLLSCLLVPLALWAGTAFRAPAFALSAPSAVSVTAVTGFEIRSDGGIAYTRGAYDPEGNAYGKGIEIEFCLGGASYYRIDVSVDGNTMEGSLTAAEDDSAVYEVKQSGAVTVTLNVFDGDKAFIASEAVSVKSDNGAPAAASAKEMDAWQAAGTVFDAELYLAGFSDDLSGRGRVFYRLGSGAVSEMDADGDVFSITIDSPGVLQVYYFDAAFNSVVKEYEYDKFDGTPPPAPEITVTPNADGAFANGFASSFEVRIDYYPDAHSGLKAEQSYSLNGVRSVYTGPFRLNQLRNYEITAYAEDAVGNISSAQASVAASSFDIVEPSVAGIQAVYDVRNELPLTVVMVASDTQSGMKSVYIQGTEIYFTPGASNSYRASLDCYNRSGTVVIAEDRAGNAAIRHITINYFGSAEFSATVRRYSDLYRSLDLSEYTAAAAGEINDAYAALNALLASDLSQQGDFDALFKTIDALVSGQNKVIYEIESAPAFISGLLTFTVSAADFPDYKKGEEIKLVMNRAPAGDFLAASGFSEGFSDGFSLRIFYKGEEVTGALESGIRVSLNMTVGYYERRYALIDSESGEALETVCLNNKIEFTLKKGSAFTLIISGSRDIKSNDKPKTINVFGNDLSYGAFFGTVFGVAGAVAVVVAIIIIKAKRNKRTYR